MMARPLGFEPKPRGFGDRHSTVELWTHLKHDLDDFLLLVNDPVTLIAFDLQVNGGRCAITTG
jgi:hypothetical protein